MPKVAPNKPHTKPRRVGVKQPETLSPAPALALPSRRSRVTSGKAAFLTTENLDPRSQAARRFVDLVAILSADVAGGEPLTEAQHQVVRRCAGLALRSEQIEARMVAGTATPEDIGDYPRLSMTMLKLLQAVGLKRQARDVTPGGKTIDAHALAVLGGGQ